jgi:hypothetical protein
MKLYAQCDKDGTIAQAGQGVGGLWVLPPGWTEVQIAGFDFQLCVACTAAWGQALSSLVAQQFPKPVIAPVTPV